MQDINSIGHTPPVIPACLLGGPENYLFGFYFSVLSVNTLEIKH